MKLLAIDTSNAPLIVAAAHDNKILAQFSNINQKAHSADLMPAIQTVTKQAGWQPNEIDRFVVAQGPGSFTGVRIAVTAAKMLAWTLNKELVGISSLQAWARNVHEQPGLVVPFFDARHQNVFAGVYQLNQHDELTNIIPDQHINMNNLLLELQKYNEPVYFLGNNLLDYRDLITQALKQRAIILNDQQPDVASLITLGLQADLVRDLNAFSPTYLRQTQAEMVWAKDHPQVSTTNYVEDV